MAEITAIEPQVKNKSRCNVYIDGRFYCGMQLEVAMRCRLTVGMHIDEAQLDEIQFENEKSQAIDKAMTHLSATMKTEKQMRDFLTKKGYTERVIDYVLERLIYYKLVDDLSYCRAYINSVKGKGKRAIEAELYKRNAKKEAIAEALADVEESVDDARALLERYLRGKEYTKANLLKGYKYLISKGYSYDVAQAATSGFGGDEF